MSNRKPNIKDTEFSNVTFRAADWTLIHRLALLSQGVCAFTAFIHSTQKHLTTSNNTFPAFPATLHYDIMAHTLSEVISTPVSQVTGVSECFHS